MPTAIRIAPQTQIPEVMPFGRYRATPQEFGGDVAQELGQGGRALQQVGLGPLDSLLATRQAQILQQQGLDVDQAVATLHTRIADATADLQTNGVLDPVTGERRPVRGVDFHPAAVAEYQRIAQEESDRLAQTYPNAGNQRSSPVLAFQRRAAGIVGAAGIGALRTGSEKTQNEQLALATTANDADEDSAIKATDPQTAATAFGAIGQRVQTLVDRGYLNETQGLAELKQRHQNITTARIDQALQDPGQAQDVIRKLFAGEYPLPVPKQMQMATTYMRQLDEERRRSRTEAEHDFDKKKGDALSYLGQQALEGTLTVDAINNANGVWRFTPQQQEWLRSAMTKPPVEAPSDAEVLDTATIATHRARPTLSEEQILGLHQRYNQGLPGLNRTDTKAMLDKLDSTNRANRSEGRAIDNEDRARLVQQFNEAQNVMLKALGITTPLENITDPVTKKLVAEGVRELYERSFYGVGKESPAAIVGEITKRLQGVKDVTTRLNVDQLGQALKHGSPQDLEQAYRSGQVSEGDYRNQRRLWQQLGDLKARNAAQDIQNKIKQLWQERAAFEQRGTLSKAFGAPFAPSSGAKPGGAGQGAAPEVTVGEQQDYTAPAEQ